MGCGAVVQQLQSVSLKSSNKKQKRLSRGADAAFAPAGSTAPSKEPRTAKEELRLLQEENAQLRAELQGEAKNNRAACVGYSFLMLWFQGFQSSGETLIFPISEWGTEFG